jgi:asparagine synthase (glutamine-hydrolysing)
MCGIVGFNSNNSNTLRNMLDKLHHRGPDDLGMIFKNNFSMGHVRLSIIDLTIGGHQPMVYENLTLVFNGEVYNHSEIRLTLESFSYTFDSSSDTEVVLKAFHKWGVNAVDRFIGMFAFSIFDSITEELYIFRDRMGVKPLYYYKNEEMFAFGSEIKSLLEYDENVEINKEALYEYFKFGYISSNGSIYNNIYKLLPGHYMVYNNNNNNIKTIQYWSVEKFLLMDEFIKSEEELIDDLENLLISAFKYRMVSDVPVGIFLSGGIDSSLVAAILQKHYGGIHTFTIGFESDKYDESVYAEKIADYLGTKHTTKIINTDDAKDYLYELANIFDEPFGDASAIPTLLVSKLAKDNGIKVVLSADGGDEIFCGYERYWKIFKIGKIIFKIPYPIRYGMSKIMSLFNEKYLSNFFKITNFQKKYSTLKNMLKAKDWNSLYINMISHHNNDNLDKLLNYSIIDKSSVLEKYFDITKKIHPMQGMMLWDQHRYLSDNILVKVDRATMYNSIEGREPLLDHRIAEFMARVPFSYKYKNGNSKYLLKKVLERYVPKELFVRPKMGFSIPKEEWLSNDLREFVDSFLTEKSNKDDLINLKNIQEEYSNLELNNKYVNFNKLWLIVIYKLWANCNPPKN